MNTAVAGPWNAKELERSALQQALRVWPQVRWLVKVQQLERLLRQMKPHLLTPTPQSLA